MASKLELYEQLHDSRDEDWLNGRRKYIPASAIDDFITKDSIKAELVRKSGNPINLSGCLAEKVMNRKAKRMFAILLYLKEPRDIKRLLNDGFTDEDLPLVKHTEGLRSSLDPKKIFHLPKNWDRQTVDEFLEKQWMLLAPVFINYGEHMVLDPECPLPFSEIDERIYSHSSVIYKAKIHPSHQEGFEVSNICVHTYN
jgi:hypothetical protein